MIEIDAKIRMMMPVEDTRSAREKEIAEWEETEQVSLTDWEEDFYFPIKVQD